MFKTLLIANRGEIACRIIKTAQAMGIKCIAVYSDADQNALHVRLADEAYYIGLSPAAESYLQVDRILEVCRQSGAEAVHPGYGFLSENAEFCEALAQAGIAFIGPPTSAIEAMGSKTAAKQIMEKAGVPLVQGYHGADQSLATLEAEAARIGYPVMIKAAAGGGGKGMRIVEGANDFATALQAAQREAKKSFGDDHVLVEKYLTKPRHVEIQIFADHQGACVYLFERDCSVQRRHQKVIEEAPAPCMDQDIRQMMGETACEAAKAIGYVGAGTVEFLLDEDGSFYFMEMNTRLQVEHPVTEMITGQDLVAWQLKIADYQPLPLGQEDLKVSGHAVEVRLYAEDPDHDFLPTTGRIVHLNFPPESKQVRIDSGIQQGDDVSVYYDPMIAKLIVWGEDRASALQGMRQALAQCEIAGVTTNVDFLTRLVAHPAFAAFDVDTGFIPRFEADLFPQQLDPPFMALAAAALVDKINVQQDSDPWAQHDGFRLGGGYVQTQSFIDLKTAQTHRVDSIREQGTFIVSALGQESRLTVTESSFGLLTLLSQKQREQVRVIPHGRFVDVFLSGTHYRFERENPLDRYEQDQGVSGGLSAPMPGKVVAVLVAEGQVVKAGDPLIILEAMKMEHTVNAPHDGRVAAIYYSVDDQISEGVALLDVQEEGEA